MKSIALSKNRINYSDRFTKTDRDYLSAVERGDMETAQKMVDEAARADIPLRCLKKLPYHSGKTAIFYYSVYFSSFCSSSLLSPLFLDTSSLGITRSTLPL